MKQSPKPAAINFSGPSYVVVKEADGFLSRAYELSIENGVVTRIISLNAPDLPASSTLEHSEQQFSESAQ